ncbi:aminoglycoside phosphotransferase family protein [Actinopolymorpha sp. B17G11]|uniref:aminoglycoside phosphotransferase family protein n=1 Tax=unclassified Actinopolymorpha TaxID=2627063 RepID=UPI0032D92AB1
MSTPPEQVLRWAANAVGAGAVVESSRSLRAGDDGPWLLRLTDGRTTIDAVLKTGPPEWHELRTEGTALAWAEQHRLPTPRLLAFEKEAAAGFLAILTAVLPGSTRIPRVATPQRLRALGAAAAAVHSVPLAPRPDLPLRTHHMPWVDRAAERRWARRYQQTTDAQERDAIVAEWRNVGLAPSQDEAHTVLRETRSTPLLDEADDRLQDMTPPRGETVFVHGDLWHANTMWDGDSYVGMIDWDAAGAGHYGVDLGSLRWDAAILFGPNAPGEILTGWEEASGRKAENVAYWDITAALNTDVELDSFVEIIHAEGRPDLDAATLTERRDGFIRTALDRLGHD